MARRQSPKKNRGIKRPIKNPVGKTWIKNQLALIKNKKRH